MVANNFLKQEFHQAVLQLVELKVIDKSALDLAPLENPLYIENQVLFGQQILERIVIPLLIDAQ